MEIETGFPPLYYGPLIALFCSRACPAALILRAHDLARAWAGAGVGVVGGFHSPTEAEMLRVLLRGRGPLVVVLALGLGGRVPRQWQAAQAAGRLQLVSPFADTVKRASRGQAEKRNRMVADLATRVLVLYAAPESSTERLALEWLAAGREVWTLAHGANAALLAAGARAWDATQIKGI
ncbi:hypothetical protein GCM10022631_24540 [Deinococcus rubellus]|uniref:DNA-processing protein DprA n=1 Tax=Deinococcus rubellus TaxID=1889240 RepID=UPI0031ED9E35